MIYTFAYKHFMMYWFLFIRTLMMPCVFANDVDYYLHRLGSLDPREKVAVVFLPPLSLSLSTSPILTFEDHLILGPCLSRPRKFFLLPSPLSKKKENVY